MPVLLNSSRHFTRHFFTEENMPYIRGRYYMNPVVGDALEAAREAEAALQALEHAAKVARGDTGEEDDAGASSSGKQAAAVPAAAALIPAPTPTPNPRQAQSIASKSKPPNSSPPTQDAPSAAS